MSKIYKVEQPNAGCQPSGAFFIDLSRITSISDIEFRNQMGFGGNFVEFRILCELQDQPIFCGTGLNYTMDQMRSNDFPNDETSNEYKAVADIWTKLISAWIKHADKSK